MNGETLQRKVVITNPQGFHLRPMAEFVKRAGEFACTVTLAKDGLRINGKSMMELMLLAAETGTELVLEVAGPGAPEALKALAEILSAPGYEEESPSPLPRKG